MTEWKDVALEDITTRIGDGLHGTPKYDSDGEYYFINGNNLKDGKILIGYRPFFAIRI
jgi:type I restriction enzyme, S subunit